MLKNRGVLQVMQRLLKVSLQSCRAPEALYRQLQTIGLIKGPENMFSLPLRITRIHEEIILPDLDL